jgi:flagellar basal-body rod protein FlgC
MEAALHNAVSGLRASAKRLEVSSSNVANARSETYAPGRVVQSALAGGGTRAEAVPVSPPTVPSYEPGNPAADAEGVVRRPNVALEGEVVEQVQAQRAYEANLRTLSTADRMTKSLLDILA